MKTSSNLLTLAFLILASPLFLNSQTQIIRGSVIDRDTRQPLIGAAIRVIDLEGAFGTVTDYDGTFILEKVPVGRHQIECSYLGYEAFVSDQMILNSAKELELDIELIEAVFQTEEVVVSAFKHGNEPLNELSIVSTRSFSVEETQRYPASANDPSRMAVGFPGVVAARDNRNDLIVRGNASFGLLWRLEGIDIPNPNHFARIGSSGGGITIFSVSMLSNSDFSAGAFPADYGNAFSGVMDIHFRNGNKEKREYTFRAGMLGLDFSTEGPIKKGQSSYLINYRYSTLGILDAMGIRLVSERESNTFQDLSFKLNFKSKDFRHIVSVWGMGGLSDEFENAIEGTENWESYTDYLTREFDTNMGATGLTHTFLINDQSYIKTNLALMGQKTIWRNDTLNTELNPSTVNDEKYLNNRLTLSSFYSRKFSPKTALKTGLIANRISYDLHRELLFGDQFRTLLQDKGNTFLLQPYGTFRFRPGPRWSFNAGLHAMFFSLNNKSAIEPRLGIRYQLGKNSALSLAYGLHSRILPIGSYFTRIGEEQPNKDLDLIRSHHLVLGMDLFFNNNYRLRIEGYYQHLFNVAVGAVATSTYSILNEIDGYATRPLTSKGTGDNVGLDITLEKFFSGGTYFILNTSVFNATYSPLNGEQYNTRFNKNFSASFMGGKEWKVGKQSTLQTGLRLLYSLGGWLTPVLSPESDPFDPRFPILDEANAFSERVPDYFRADIRLAYRKDNPGSAWSIALDVQNVTNRRNIDVLNREYDPDLEQWVYREQSSLVPVLSFQVDF